MVLTVDVVLEHVSWIGFLTQKVDIHQWKSSFDGLSYIPNKDNKILIAHCIIKAISII